MQLAIFPMRLNLLPDGILPLRIFEPRYQRMIAEMGQREFGLCLLGKSIDSGATPLLTVGTRVEVIDFDLMPDQTLSVTVRGVDRFRIQKIVAEPDGLMGAEVELLPQWRHAPLLPSQSILAEKLGELFAENPHYASYYPQPKWSDICWVVQRWLEVLPLDAEDKFPMIASDDYQDALHFLLETIQEGDVVVHYH